MSYDRVNWKDYPEETTPITAANLNVMDSGIKSLDDKIGQVSITSYGASVTDAIAAEGAKIASLESAVPTKQASLSGGNFTGNIDSLRTAGDYWIHKSTLSGGTFWQTSDFYAILRVGFYGVCVQTAFMYVGNINPLCQYMRMYVNNVWTPWTAVANEDAVMTSLINQSNYDQEYAASQASSALSSAKTYAASQASSALSSAKTYADSKSDSALATAKAYADAVGSNTLSTAKSYTDTKRNELYNMVSDVNANVNSINSTLTSSKAGKVSKKFNSSAPVKFVFPSNIDCNGIIVTSAGASNRCSMFIVNSDNGSLFVQPVYQGSTISYTMSQSSSGTGYLTLKTTGNNTMATWIGSADISTTGGV